AALPAWAGGATTGGPPEPSTRATARWSRALAWRIAAAAARAGSVGWRSGATSGAGAHAARVPGAQVADVRLRGVRGLGRVGEQPQVARRRQPALERVHHVQPDQDRVRAPGGGRGGHRALRLLPADRGPRRHGGAAGRAEPER